MVARGNGLTAVLGVYCEVAACFKAWGLGETLTSVTALTGVGLLDPGLTVLGTAAVPTGIMCSRSVGCPTR